MFNIRIIGVKTANLKGKEGPLGTPANYNKGGLCPLCFFVHRVCPLVCSICERGGSHACVCCYGTEVIPHVSLSEQLSLPAPLLLLLS